MIGPAIVNIQFDHVNRDGFGQLPATASHTDNSARFVALLLQATRVKAAMRTKTIRVTTMVRQRWGLKCLPFIFDTCHRVVW